MVRRTKAEAEQTFHELLDAAVILFLRQGIANTSLKDIADLAGKTRGAIYWHFDNKDSVVQALWQRNAETYHQSLTKMASAIETEDPAKSFRQEIKNLIQNLLGDEEFGKVLRIVIHSVEFTDEHTSLQNFLTDKKMDFILALKSSIEMLQQQRKIRVKLPSELLSQALFSYIHGLVDNYLKPGHDSLDLVKDGDVLIDLFLDSILQ